METTGNLNPAIGPDSSDTARRMVEAAKPVVDKAAAAAHQTVDSLAGAANEAVDSLATRSVQLRKIQERLVNNCSSYVQENPLTSIGIALATGFLLSRLFNSR